MGDFLVIHDLRRYYGKRLALDGLCMSVPEKSTAAFIGANGAGKTTTFSLIGEFIRSHGGEIHVAGVPLSEFRGNGGMIGLLPQEAGLQESRSIASQLLLFARLAGLSGSAAHSEVARVLELVGLSDRSNERINQLSHGMKVRVGVAQAFVGSPPLVLLDEPTAGLDPRVNFELRNTLKILSGSTTMVISSHNLSELEDLCDFACIIHAGKLVRQGAMSELLTKVTRVSYTLGQTGISLDDLKRELPSVSFNFHDSQTVLAEFNAREHSVPEINGKVLAWLLSKGIPILSVEGQKSLEQTYLEETKDR